MEILQQSQQQQQIEILQLSQHQPIVNVINQNDDVSEMDKEIDLYEKMERNTESPEDKSRMISFLKPSILYCHLQGN
jgi:hypothetical protein